MAYSSADVFRVYKNNPKLALGHCGLIRSLGSQTHSLCVSRALLVVTLGKRLPFPSLLSPLSAKDSSGVRDTGSQENEVREEM